MSDALAPVLRARRRSHGIIRKTVFIISPPIDNLRIYTLSEVDGPSMTYERTVCEKKAKPQALVVGQTSGVKTFAFNGLRAILYHVSR
jgi:hypothetical protein